MRFKASSRKCRPFCPCLNLLIWSNWYRSANLWFPASRLFWNYFTQEKICCAHSWNIIMYCWVQEQITPTYYHKTRWCIKVRIERVNCLGNLFDKSTNGYRDIQTDMPEMPNHICQRNNLFLYVLYLWISLILYLRMKFKTYTHTHTHTHIYIYIYISQIRT